MTVGLFKSIYTGMTQVTLNYWMISESEDDK